MPAPGLFLAILDLSTPANAVSEQFRVSLDLLFENLSGVDPAEYPLEIVLFGTRRTDEGFQFFSLNREDFRSQDPEAGETPALQKPDTGETPAIQDLPERGHLARSSLDTSGEPAPVESLAAAYRVVLRWIASHPNCRPPVVVHLTAEGIENPAYQTIARSLTHLVPNPRFLPIAWAELDGVFPMEEVWNQLFDPASEAVPLEPTPDPAFEIVREFWVQKLGNDPNHWEDGYAHDATTGAVAICDGASEGIFCRAWAALLSQRFLVDRPTAANFAEWVASCRPAWRTTIDYPQLKWSAQNKAEGTGAAATLCAMTFGPASENGSRPWHAVAVGDACLFWVKKGKAVLTFPLVADEQLGSAPDLLRTRPGRGIVPTSTAAGTCRPGDLFLLATDAVAGVLFREAEAEFPHLDRYVELSNEDWQQEIATRRADGAIVNDDCTLLVLRVLERPEVSDVVSDPVQADHNEISVEDSTSRSNVGM